MKKQLLFLLFALLALCASAAPNDVFSVGDITYSVTLDSYSGKPGIVAVKSLSAQGKAKTSLKLDIPGVVSYNGYKYKVGVINYDAFKGQSNISVVQIRYNITRIAQSAFENCTSLTTVYMPSSLTNVGYRAFGGCTALRSVYYANATPSSTSVVPGSFPENSGMTLYVSKAHPNSVENARKVTAFDYFSTIKKHEYACDFILGEHGYFCVTKAPLSDGSTRGEMSLVGVYADDNFNYAWSGAYNNGILDFDVVEIADSACLGNTNIKNVYLSSYSKLRRIGDSAFNGCSSIEWVQMATSSLQQIGKYAFKGCNLLTTIKLPENVYSCSAYFVDGCTKLGYISVDSKNTNYASYNGILYDKGLTILFRCPEGYTYKKVLDSNSLPPTLKKVGNYAFEYCKYVEEIYFPYGLTSFGIGTFRYCSGLTTLQLPSSHTGWGEGSFVGATALDVLYVNQEDAYGLEVSRRVNEFDDCKRGTLYVGGWISSFNWGPWAKWKNCKREAYDYLATNGLRYTIINGNAQTVDGEKFDGSAKLFYAPHNTGKSEIVIQDYITLPGGKKYAVTKVGTHVFGTGNTLSVKTNLTLGKHVRTIAEQAFLDQTNLVGLKLNPNLKVIGVNGFGNCRIATDVILPCGFTTLESHAFYNNSFKRILIPSSVTKMDSKCIAKNNYLQEIILNNAQFAYNYIDLENVPKSCKLYVPAGSEEAFKKNQYWSTLQVMEGAYDFTYQDADPYNTIYHMSVISHSPFTIDGVTYAGRARY
ncbi:MAG: leucine-rich repeat protein, partial [Sodaliphilus sp.]|nr:leucine-rich repeat protein [Sodaliphilus sp.]